MAGRNFFFSRETFSLSVLPAWICCNVCVLMSLTLACFNSQLTVLCVITLVRCWKKSLWYHVQNSLLRSGLGTVTSRVAEGR